MYASILYLFIHGILDFFFAVFIYIGTDLIKQNLIHWVNKQIGMRLSQNITKVYLYEPGGIT